MVIGIGFDRDIKGLKDMIDIYFDNKNISIQNHEESRYILHIKKTKQKTICNEEFYDIVAKMILNIILNIYSEDIIEKQARTLPKNLKKWERKKIIEISKSLLSDKNTFLVEKDYIYNKIRDYIKEIPILWIDGFIQFRLKELRIFMDLVIEKGIKEFNAEKEYEEFIKILRYFVDVQEPKYELVNLIFNDKDYILYDEKDDIIDVNFFEEIIAEIDDQKISKDDLLISSLIVIAPKKLQIHLDKKYRDKDVIRIIENVFQERIYFCYGCGKCGGWIRTNRNKPY